MKDKSNLIVLGFLLVWGLVFVAIYSTQAAGAIAQLPGGKQQAVIDSIIEASVSSDESVEAGEPAAAGEPVPTPAFSGGPTVGIDVSKWQGAIDWQAVAGAGYQFAIIKATEGTNYVDPYFATNWEGAKAAGLLVSAYHMLWPSLSAEKQAEHFLATLGERKADFPLVLDAERPAVGNIGAFVEEMALAVEAADNRKPFIYTARNYWNAHVGWAPGWSEYPLWVADYDAAAPAMPGGWNDWACWQYSNTGKVPGIAGNVDLDVCKR